MGIPLTPSDWQPEKAAYPEAHAAAAERLLVTHLIKKLDRIVAKMLDQSGNNG